MSGVLQSLGLSWQGLVTEIIGFLILIALLVRFGFKPIFTMLDDRANDIKTTYDQLDADRAAMERTRKEYEERLAGIEAQAREKIQAAVKEAQELRAAMLADAKQQADTVIENGRADLERERSKAFAEMRQQVADLAIMAASKVIGESVDDARSRTLVDQFIASVGSTSESGVKPFSTNGSTGTNGGSTKAGA